MSTFKILRIHSKKFKQRFQNPKHLLFYIDFLYLNRDTKFQIDKKHINLKLESLIKIIKHLDVSYKILYNRVILNYSTKIDIIIHMLLFKRQGKSHMRTAINTCPWERGLGVGVSTPHRPAPP